MINLSKIGGTDAPALLKQHPYKRPIDIYRRIVEGVVDESESRAAVRGKRLETPIITWWAEEAGEELVAPPTGEDERFRWTPDGATKSGKLVEIKTASPKMWRAWAEGPPQHYLSQVQWYLRHTGVEAAVLVAFMGDDIQEYIIEADKHLADGLVGAANAFWDKHIATKTPPPPDGSDAYLEHLKELPRSGLIIPASPEIEALKNEYEALAAAADMATTEAERAKQMLLAAIGDAEGVDGLGWRLSYKAQSRKTTSWKDVAIDANIKSDLIAKHTKTSTTRVFRITNGAK